MLKRLAVHLSHYSLGTLLVIIAGLVSFPIFTRVFSVEQYGAMSLVTSTLLLATVVGKFGMQHSIVRFHEEMRAGKTPETAQQFFSTVVIGMGVVGAVISLGWLLLSQMIPESWWSHPGMHGLFALTAVLILVRVMDSAQMNLLRAQHLSGWYSVYNVVRRYAILAGALGAVFLFSATLEGFFGGTLLAEVLTTGFVAWYLWKRHEMGGSQFSPRLFKAMALFGIPMVAYEFAGVILNIGDRYVIQSVMGSGPLGTYAAAFNMCEYIQSVLSTALSLAVTPMYTRLWEEQGREATQVFVEKVLRYYLLGTVAIVTAMWLVGGQLLVLLASAKYEPGAVVIPPVIAAMALDGAMPVVGAGLFLAKQTKKLMVLVILSASLNMTLNLFLVPQLGLLGAGLSFLCSMIFLAAGVSVLGARTLPVRFPVLALLKYAGSGFVAFEVARWTVPQGGVATIFAALGVGALVYAALVLMLDESVRTVLRVVWQKVRSRSA